MKIAQKLGLLVGGVLLLMIAIVAGLSLLALRIAHQNASVAVRTQDVEHDLAVVVLIVVAAVFLAAAAVSLVARNIVRPVRALTTAVLAVADTQLAAAVARIAASATEAPAPVLPAFEVKSRNELFDLAAALTLLQGTAIGLAAGQRRAQQDDADSWIALERRNRGLLAQVIAGVTELEQEELDPTALDKLYRVDHLATQIRRNSESVLLLAGAKPTRTWAEPIPIDDVLRAALFEIEEYSRVTVHHADQIAVDGQVAADLAHVLAELLENAVRFSPPDRQVVVVGRLTPSGYQFDVIDSGPGMTEPELAEINARITQRGLEGAGRPDPLVVGHVVVGHRVVERIVSRSGIFVRLLPSTEVGTTAQVLIPQNLLTDMELSETETTPPSAVTAPTPVAEPAANPSPPASASPAPAPTPVRSSTLPPRVPAPVPAPVPGPGRARKPR